MDQLAQPTATAQTLEGVHYQLIFISIIVLVFAN
jgi:hypothetical protein